MQLLRKRAQCLRVPVMVVTFVLAGGLTACSSTEDALCGPEESVGVVASAIAIGQYEFDETDGGATLRLAVSAALNQLEIVTDEATTELAAQATVVKNYFETF